MYIHKAHNPIYNENLIEIQTLQWVLSEVGKKRNNHYYCLELHPSDIKCIIELLFIYPIDIDRTRFWWL
jgi:hypothetical protein